MENPRGNAHNFCKSWEFVQHWHNVELLCSKPLSHDIVTEGLRRLKTGGSPGVDGIPAEILKAFPDVMVPQMFSCIKTFLTAGALPSGWMEGMITMVPKSFGEPYVVNLRPIALQTTRQKWETNVLLIQLEDVLAQCIPPEQTGFIKNRSILQHIYSARSLRESFEETGAGGLSIDFRNAFPTMSHA